jgi:phosphopantothenoylcysteine decarboxylase/phosphopantothenate--cysteine ligase
LDMYKHPATQANISTLTRFGHFLIPAEHGDLASGLEGQGRMAEPETIVLAITNDLRQKAPLNGKRILINAGPTYEAIDPVRFIGNRSSGKMGMALAEAAANYGAQVHLVLGPSHVTTSNPAIKMERVESTQEMLDASLNGFESADWAILSAAVSDYRPLNTADQKIKKSGSSVSLALIENPDILKTLGGLKQERQVVVGFALETENAEANAVKKLHTKNCDWIVLNQADKTARGFGHDTNEVLVIGRKGEREKLSLKPKKELAYEILDILIEHHISR